MTNILISIMISPQSSSRVTSLLLSKNFNIFWIINYLIPFSVLNKGIMWFDESPKRHIFYLCSKRFNLDDDEWKDTPKNQLLLIGRNLNRQTLLEQLENCFC